MAGALSVFGLALAPSAGAVTTVTTERYAGATRYDTAKLISAAAAFAAPKSAIIATGENFPDALAAATLAGSVRPAPIILTTTAALSPEASAALTALKGKGVTAVHIVGGTSAVSQATEDAVKALGLTVTRHQGTGTAATRYGTAAQIAQDSNTISATGSVGGLKAAFFATGLNFADAVSAAPGAYAARLPVLLVNDTVPAETQAAITALGIKKAIVLGGTSAVSDAVSTQLGTLTGNAVTRIQGTADAGSSQDRFGTAAAIADYLVANLGFPNPTSAILANGTDAKGGVDALASGPLGGEVKAPVLLTASLPSATQAWLDRRSNTLTKLYASGGETVIDATTLSSAVTAAQNTSNDTAGNLGGTSVTSRPELVSASVLATTAVGSNPGTSIRYTFDEALTGATALTFTNFKLYTAAGAALAASSSVIDPTDNKSVLAGFSTLTSSNDVSAYAVATTLAGSVTQLAGGLNATNPEGNVVLQGTTSTTAAAGVTDAPDLVTVGNFRASGSATTLVDFTFDENSYVFGGGFHVVTLPGTTTSDVTCTVVPPPAGVTSFGDGTPIQTVLCANQAATGPLTATNVVRGFVAAGTVRDGATGGNANPIEAADVSNGGNNAGTPNLVSAEFQPNAVIGATQFDAVLYTFDRPVLLPGAVTTGPGTLFGAYSTTGTTTTAGASNAIRSTTNDTQVLAYFADGTLNSAVGANVGDSAVISASTTAFSQEDEVAVAPSSTVSTLGTTDAPDLSSVTLAQITDAFGTVIGVRATFTFDEAVLQPIDGNAGSFKLWAADGSGPFACSGTLAGGTFVRPSTATSSVICSSFTNFTSLGQLFGSTLGTVAAGAATETAAGALTNPEGARVSTGGNGTPQA